MLSHSRNGGYAPGTSQPIDSHCICFRALHPKIFPTRAPGRVQPLDWYTRCLTATDNSLALNPLSDELARLLAWARRGGSLRGHPLPGAGQVWKVSDQVLGISAHSSDRHPVIILTVDPLTAIPGSSTYQYGIEASCVTLTSSDLEPTSDGIGFSRPTTFDVCHAIPLNSKDLRTFIGCLREASFQRILASRGTCF
jgi:hypothetical protein